MKKNVLIAVVVGLLLCTLFFAGCMFPPAGEEVTVTITSKAESDGDRGLYPKAVETGNVRVEEYDVIFEKVEISWDGNTIETLWENEDGETANIVEEVELSSSHTNKIASGEYRAIRLTIDKTLRLKGDVDLNEDGDFDDPDDILDGEAEEDVDTKYVWATEEVAEEFGADNLLAEAFTIQEGTEFSFIVDLTDAVDYTDADGLLLEVPKISVEVSE